MRYSGNYSTGGQTLPAVKYFEAWNEPNLSTYITPQWSGKTNVASDIFGALLNNFYDEVKAVDPGAKVVLGGHRPLRRPPGRAETGPGRCASCRRCSA